MSLYPNTCKAGSKLVTYYCKATYKNISKNHLIGKKEKKRKRKLTFTPYVTVDCGTYPSDGRDVCVCYSGHKTMQETRSKAVSKKGNL